MQRQIEQIYRQHRQGLYTLALAVTRRPDLAEDAIQDAFARIWKLRDDATADWVAYVYAAVRNASIDQVRRSRPAGPEVENVSIYDGRDPRDCAIDAERQLLVQQAIESLGDEQREAVVLKIYGELTFEQMATVLNEPLPTVASRYRRALETLEETLGNKI